MKKRTIAGLFVVMTTLSCVVGAGAGYFAATGIPYAVPIAVLDIDASLNKLNRSDPDYLAKRSALVVAMHQRADRLVAAGVIVLDAGKIIAAPAGAYIDVD